MSVKVAGCRLANATDCRPTECSRSFAPPIDELTRTRTRTITKLGTKGGEGGRNHMVEGMGVEGCGERVRERAAFLLLSRRL